VIASAIHSAEISVAGIGFGYTTTEPGRMPGDTLRFANGAACKRLDTRLLDTAVVRYCDEQQISMEVTHDQARFTSSLIALHDHDIGQRDPRVPCHLHYVLDNARPMFVAAAGPNAYNTGCLEIGSSAMTILSFKFGTHEFAD
jgi:hypothetical protein